MMLGVLVWAAGAVDRSRYRTCDKSRFCSRDRTVERQNWTLLPQTIASRPAVFEAIIKDGAYSNELRLKIFFLSCGAARIRIEPKSKESFNRFDLITEPTVIRQAEIKSVVNFEMQKSDKNVVLKNGQQVIDIQYEPFMIVVSDRRGKRMTMNPEDTAIFETGRDKSKYPELFESYNWGGHNDKFKNGPTSVAMDVEFHAEGVRMSGLPSHTLPMNLKQTVNVSDPIRLFNTDINQFEIDSVMSMYGAVPYFLAHSLSGCDGVFWCNPSETWADITTNGTNQVRFMAEGGYIDLFVFSGSTKEVADTFTRLTGRPQLIPYFALAFHQCRWGYMTSSELMDVSRSLDQHFVPHDVLWLDLDHTDDRKYFTFHPTNFKEPLKLLDDLECNKRKLVVLVDPHLRAERSYSVYAEAVDKSLVIKDDKGDGNFVGNCWPGKSSWPDYLNPATREWWETNFRYDKHKQSRPNLHIWNDMNEIAVFDSCDLTAPRDLVHFGNIEEREVHNIYGNLMVSATFGGMVKRNSDHNQRPFILTRSFFAGTQRYAAVWSGDNAAEWSHLRNSVAVVITYGLCAQVYNGADIGGFFDSPDQQLLARWYQVGAWLYPFFRCHCHHLSEHREIYTMKDDDYRTVAREAIVDRYRLLPYWYTLSRQANLTGEPIVRPLWWEFTEEKVVDIYDMAMVGSGLLVTPILDKDAESMKIDLPSNTRWYCFKTLTEITASEVEVHVNGGRTPVFLRGGSIIPSKNRIRKSSTLMFWDPFMLIIGLDGEGKAQGELYVDDGETFSFSKGEFIHKKYVFDGKTLAGFDVTGESKNSFINRYDVVIDQIKIVGLANHPKKIHNKEGTELRFGFVDGVLTIHRPQIPVRDNFEISFDY